MCVCVCVCACVRVFSGNVFVIIFTGIGSGSVCLCMFSGCLDVNIYYPYLRATCLCQVVRGCVQMTTFPQMASSKYSTTFTTFVNKLETNIFLFIECPPDYIY